MNKNEIFTLWIPNDNKTELPILAHLSLKSMILCGHDVILYTYSYLDNVPEGVKVLDANEILDSSRIFRYKSGHKTYSGFANLFRLKRLYEYGGTWLDLDILLIRNINDKFDDDIIICSEPTGIFYSKPNNAVLRFPPKDPFVKSMLDYAEKRGSDIIHGETGPTLILKTLKGEFYEYNRYLKNFNFNNLLRWSHLDEYSKPPRELLNNSYTDEIIGFHLVNTFFEEKMRTDNTNGLFSKLKESILNSNNHEEYSSYLSQIITNHETTANDLILKYLDNLSNNLNEEYKYTIIIDAKNLKKIEIYTILHSIGYDSTFDDLMVGHEDTLSDKQIIILGKTNLANDKIKFKNNIIILPLNFEKYYLNIRKLICGEYIIPINKAIIFKPGFFKDKIIKSNIEQYSDSKTNLCINIIHKTNFIPLLTANAPIFNLTNEMLNDEDLKHFGDGYVFDYENRDEKSMKLMQLIDQIDELTSEEISSEYLKIKQELLNLNMKNPIDKISYHYYSSYKNVINSSYYHQYKLKEENTLLKCLNEVQINKINNFEI